MSQTYPKAVQNFNAVVLNGFLNLIYEQVENYNTDTSTGTNINQYSYYFPITTISLKLIKVEAINSLFEISCQNEQLSFAEGEYFDITNGILLDPGAVYSLILYALSL